MLHLGILLVLTSYGVRRSKQNTNFDKPDLFPVSGAMVARCVLIWGPVSVTGASRRDPVIEYFFLNMTWDIPSPVCTHCNKILLSLSGIEPRFLRQRVHYTVYAIPAVGIIPRCISVRLFTGILQLLHRAHTVLFLLQMHRHLLTSCKHCFVNCFPREFL
jgi:hypothetical protein